ncbi:hypothetical protein SARC_12340 [Sphaeroforma arctica JP610]|uniref:NTR domain-containing protein n=1 Tax=Sphaeroforma arctica JP610 TaxID=667725 RepID=A0A0L0FGH4_9EUKA|nr:hypothetical protein SARC_12340 [Sphaeroforma arctica JP610]KNC75128.1 hypothetical protein SARC_12340 [Sphaeroforma arctica JP610]|eukprot:XP_014149030.1 hypothetical protein SARC_12340 [Sphaeroforma arctica JP610]
MKVSQVFVVVVSVLAVLSEGCSCPGPLTTKEEYCQASFVTLAKFKSYSAATGEAEFKVSHVLKGIPEDQTTINVVVGDGSISCDLDGEGFLKNRRYLIAGSTKEGRYFVNTGCGYFVRRWKEIPLPQRREWFQIYKLVEEEVCKVERQCPENCTSYFDGCNQCGCDLETGKLTYCTERFCSPEELEEPSCTSEIDPNCNPNPCAEGETYRPGKNLSEYVYDAPASPCDTVLCNIGETCETILGAAVCRPFTTCAQVLCEAGVSVCTDGPDRDAECIPNPVPW